MPAHKRRSRTAPRERYIHTTGAVMHIDYEPIFKALDELALLLGRNPTDAEIQALTERKILEQARAQYPNMFPEEPHP